MDIDEREVLGEHEDRLALFETRLRWLEELTGQLVRLLAQLPRSEREQEAA